MIWERDLNPSVLCSYSKVVSLTPKEFKSHLRQFDEVEYKLNTINTAAIATTASSINIVTSPNLSLIIMPLFLSPSPQSHSKVLLLSIP